MLFLGQVDHRVYEDCPGVHPDLLKCFYGVHGKPIQRQAYQTGAGHPADEEESSDSDSDSNSEEEYDEWYGVGAVDTSEGENDEWQGIGFEIEDLEQVAGAGDILPNYKEIVNQIGEEDEGQFNREAVEPPKHNDPFRHKFFYNMFKRALAQLKDSGNIPVGYGIHPMEWDDDGYPAFGIIWTGRRGRRELHIALPDSIWRPCSLLWVQALYLMNQLIDRQTQ